MFRGASRRGMTRENETQAYVCRRCTQASNTSISSSLQCFYRVYNVQMIHPGVFCLVLGFLLLTTHESSGVEKKDADESQNARPTAYLRNICRTISTSLHSRQNSIHLFLQDHVSHPINLESRLALVCCRPIAEVFRFESFQTRA